MNDHRALRGISRDDCIKLWAGKLRRIGARGSGLHSSSEVNRPAGSDPAGDEFAQRENQMVPERVRSSRLVETSDELKHAIEVGPGVAIRANASPPPLQLGGFGVALFSCTGQTLLTSSMGGAGS